MQKIALLFGIMATYGCSDKKASQSADDISPKLDSWCERIYQNAPDRKESLRCETEHFLFSIGTDHDWVALFFKDKRPHVATSISSSAFFMSGGKRLTPTLGDAGDGRTPGAKFMKTSQSFDSLLFEYQIGESAVEKVTFSYVNGAWSAPKRLGEQGSEHQPATTP